MLCNIKKPRVKANYSVHKLSVCKQIECSLDSFLAVIRTLTLHRSSDVLRLWSSGQLLGFISLSNPSQAVTSTSNMLAYRPRFRDSHNSGLGVVFVNIHGIFPCVRATSYSASCGILTHGEDGFFQGRSFIQAADGGNDMRVFSSTQNIETYGVAIEGCPEITSTCWRQSASITVFCLLPRQHCG